ncbi:MAG: DNA-methyltransferase [Candidatus Nealsonbacteria bacterium]
MKKEVKNKKFINQITCAGVLKFLPQIETDSIDLVLTDPPYFLHKMDNNWKHKTVNNKKNQHTVKSLPAGMKFDREQGKRFYSWYLKVAKEVFRILKPGAFFFSFSSPRLYHRMTSAIDDVGFLVRDCFLWIYTQNQAKAMSLNHFIDKLDTDKKTKEKIKKKLQGWKTPQIKSCFEPIAVAQKPPEDTFLSNALKHEVGLFNTNIRVGKNMFPSNILMVDSVDYFMDRYFLIPKPTKEEKGDFNGHQTVKPLTICEHLIKLSTFSKDAVVLDPFLGSGTTAVAARNLGRKFIGIDINPEYVAIAKKRLRHKNKINLKLIL